MGKLKSSINNILGLSMTETDIVNDAEELFAEGGDVMNPEGELQLYEIFFADGEVTEADDGLIYKDIMREGEWAYRPGPGQKPTPIPLRVVAGNATSEEEIGMSDLVEAYNDAAIDHVTIPTSHDDKPHENTGYVKKLTIEEGENGKKVLRAGLDFTEPDIKAKALRGSIANTSAGIIFDYIKKDSGKKYRQALGHVALTNKPWLNGMKPFGVMASEDEEFEITPLILADVVWDEQKSLTWLRDQVNVAINKDRQGDNQYYVADITNGKALVAAFDTTSGNNENFVVPFQVRGGDIKIPAEEKWIQASREWVETALSEEKTYLEATKEKIFDGDDSSSEEAPKQVAVNDPNDGGKNTMGEEQTEKKVAGAPSNDPASVPASTDNSEALEALKADFSEQLKAEREEAEELRKTVHSMKVEKRVEELKSAGFSEHAGLLAEIRDVMLADTGKSVLTLSETEGDTSKEVALSATDIVERIISKLPKKDERVQLGEQALAVEDVERPRVEVDTNLSEEERTSALADGLGIANPIKKDGDK